MEIFVGVLFLLIISALLNQRIQAHLKSWLHKYPGNIFLVPFILAMFVCFVAAQDGGNVRPDFHHLINFAFAYTFIPTFLIYNCGHWNPDNKNRRAGSWIEFVVILLLWLPIELSMTINSGRWLRSYLHNSTHVLSYGVAITLGLTFFLLFKQMKDIKYNLPRSREDFFLPLRGLLVAAAILIPLGILLKFIGSFNVPADLIIFKNQFSLVAGIPILFGVIFFGVALAEEILFRSLIQNWLMQKFGSTNKVLFVSALIFGASHLNNFSKLKDGTITASPPNLKYVLIATVAGFIYGKVFQESKSVFSSVGLHAAVNTVRHTFFS